MTTKEQNLKETLGEFSNYGFRLEEPDDHILILYFKEKEIAKYNQGKVTTEIILEGCKNYLMNTLKNI